MSLPYGFKAQANRIAVGLRRQLGLAAQAPLNVHALATHLGIAVVPLSAFKQWCGEQVEQLTKRDAGGFSAALISFGDGRRMVIVNDEHTPVRQNSDIAQEFGHALLVHPLEVVKRLVRDGCPAAASEVVGGRFGGWVDWIDSVRTVLQGDVAEPALLGAGHAHWWLRSRDASD